MKKTALVVLGLSLFLFGCKKDENLSTGSTSHAASGTLKGYAQKGPFVVGSSITVFELDANFYQTGRSFFSQINDNTGSFEVGNINLVSKNVVIKADGFYYNEICGANSVSQISLNCISDVSNASSLNVNLMTHLEKPRVEYLLSQGISFNAAKAQAQAEVMSVFNMNLTGMPPSENLNICQAGDTNAVLLAISSILQGFRKEGELSSMLATIGGDLKADGVLNDSTIKSSLIDQAVLLDTIAIRNNLSVFYSSQGTSFSIPNFEKYIRQFTGNTTFPRTNSVIVYPQNGIYGANLLDKSQTTYNSAQNYASMAGSAKKCCNVKFRIRTISGFGIGWAQGTGPNFNVTGSGGDWLFTVINPEFSFDYDVSLSVGVYLIDYYENNMNTPTFSKTITVN